jgi:peptidyl-prolyl cis-trans isomerase D
MEAFRSQGLKSAVYGVIVIAIAVVFLIQFRPAGSGKGQAIKNECVAEVRGECISVRDYRSSLSLAAPRMEEQALKQLQLRRLILDGLVERSLLKQDAERLGIAVSDDELNAALMAGQALVSLSVDTPPFILQYRLRLSPERPMRVLDVKGPNGQFDEKAYTKSLRAYVGRGAAEFREMQKDEHLAARMRDIVKARVRISEDEAFAAFQREKSTASLRYVKLSRHWFGAHLDANKDAVEAFTAAHKEEIDSAWNGRKSQYLPECRKAKHILVKAAADTASDEEKAAARKKIEAARERVKKGDAFEDVAREVSEDTSASEGGNLGCFQKGRMVKPFEDTVFALKPGEMSDVVQTEYGFHVIRLDAVLKDDAAEAEGRREIARDLFRNVEGETKAVEAAKQIQADLAGGKTMDEAVARALINAFPRPSRKKDDAKKDEAKKDDAKKDDAKKDDGKKDDGKKEKEDEGQPKVEEAKDFTRDGTPIPGILQPDVAALAFSLTKPGDTPPDLLKYDDGYAVIQLTEKKPATKEAFLKEGDKYARSLLAQKQQDALAAYVTRLREVAKSETKVNQAYASDKAPAEEAPAD